MSMGLSALKPWLPPALRDLVRPRPVALSEEYPSWEAASARASGYDSQQITERVLTATRSVVAGEAAYERDSVVFNRVEYSWPLLASLLQVAVERRSLRVLDFGGSLGSTWRQNRLFLIRAKVPLTWHVVEQDHLVTLGNDEFADEHVRFYANISEAAMGGVDVALFSSSLCYIPDPAEILGQVRQTSAAFLVIDRLPTVAGARDQIRVQRVREPIYEASYPIRLFGRERLMSGLFVGWRLLESWDCDLQLDPKSLCRGFFLERL